MKAKSLLSLGLAAATMWAATGCKINQGKVKALQSDDWMRDGVDRFYLAVAPQNLEMEGTTTGAKVGQEMLYGIGCFGEPKDRASPIDTRDVCGAPARMPLDERYMVHQFPLAENPAQAKKGECVILLGDEEVLAHLQLFPKDYQTGPGSAAMVSAATTVGSAAATTFIFLPAITKAVTVPGALRPAKQVVWSAAATLAKSSNPLNRAAVQLDMFRRFGFRPQFMPITALKTSQAGVQRNVERFSRWLTGAANVSQAPATATGTGIARRAAAVSQGLFSWVPGGAGTVIVAGIAMYSVWGLTTKSQRSKNRVAFFKGMNDADRLAKEFLEKSPEGATFKSLVDAGNLREAAAFFNPIFAQQFNKNVHGSFEQGWSLLRQRPTKFFDTVRDIQAELQAVSQQTESAGEFPEGGALGENAPSDGTTPEEAASVANAPIGQMEPSAGNAAPGNGAPANGAPANGAPANGAPANGAPANGAPGNGAAGNGSAIP